MERLGYILDSKASRDEMHKALLVVEERIEASLAGVSGNGSQHKVSLIKHARLRGKEEGSGGQEP